MYITKLLGGESCQGFGSIFLTSQTLNDLFNKLKEKEVTSILFWFVSSGLLIRDQ